MVFPCFCQMPRALLMWDANSSTRFSDIDNTNTVANLLEASIRVVNAQRTCFLFSYEGKVKQASFLISPYLGLSFLFCFVFLTLRMQPLTFSGKVSFPLLTKDWP